PRTEFASLVKKHLAERAAKGFTCWTQFVAMTFCQLAHADSCQRRLNIPQFPPVENSPLSPVDSPGAERRL
ncbi:MAG TPA: DUF4372 domain-containing protein, partial [Terriglobales bacterium]